MVKRMSVGRSALRSLACVVGLLAGAENALAAEGCYVFNSLTRVANYGIDRALITGQPPSTPRTRTQVDFPTNSRLGRACADASRHKLAFSAVTISGFPYVEVCGNISQDLSSSQSVYVILNSVTRCTVQ